VPLGRLLGWRVCRAVRVIHIERAAGRVGTMSHSTPSFRLCVGVCRSCCCSLPDVFRLAVFLTRFGMTYHDQCVLPPAALQRCVGRAKCGACSVLLVCVVRETAC
jgi:hypothetical protein